MEIERRPYLQKMIRKRGNGLIKIVDGIRGCGKTRLLFGQFRAFLLSDGVREDHIIEVALDDEANAPLRDPDEMLSYVKSRITDGGTYYIFLDEVQEMREFEDVLNSFLHIRNADTYVTGSDSEGLTTDVITEFRGRGDEIRLHPLSFGEFMSAYGGDEADGLREYVRYGGLPYTLSCGTGREMAEYLTSHLDGICMNDLMGRHRIRDGRRFGELPNLLASSAGSLLNPLRISDALTDADGGKASSMTTSNYLRYLEDAFLISRAVCYDVKGRRRINSASRYYFEDTGLRNAALGFGREDGGLPMENLIYNELRIRGFRVEVGVVDLYGKDGGKSTRGRCLVDFVAVRGPDRYYIQSAYRPSEEETARKKRAMLEIRDAFGKFLIVDGNAGPWRDPYGVVTMGLTHFLLDEDSLTSF